MAITEYLSRARNYVTDYGADPTGAVDSSAAFQAAIEAVRAGGGGIVDIPDGKYRLDDSIELTNPDSGFAFMHLRGSGGYVASLDNSMAGVTLDFRNMPPDRPAIIVQGSRATIIEGIVIQGANAQPLLNAGALTTDSESDWITSGIGITSGQYNPYCAIAIDPFSGTAPVGGYSGATYGRNHSAAVTIRECAIWGFVVGLMCKPSDDQNQCEYLAVENTTFRGNTYAYSVGATQARTCTFTNVNTEYCLTAFTGATHGQKTGLCPNIHGGGAVRCYNLFDFNGGYNCIEVTGFYAETIRCIGYLGKGATATAYAASFKGCGFRFDSTLTQLDQHPFHVAVFVPTIFEGCYFQTMGGFFNVAGGSEDVSFKACQFAETGATWNDIYYTARGKDFNQPLVLLEACSWVTDYWTTQAQNPAHNTINANGLTLPNRIEFHPMASKWFLQPQKTFELIGGNSNTYVTSAITGVAAVPGELVFTATTIAEFAVGDVLFWRTIAMPRANNLQFTIPLARIRAIVGSVVTADWLCDPDFIDMAYTGSGFGQIAQREYATGSVVTGVITSGSPSVTGVTSATSFFRAGDFISGPGIPSKTRVTAVSGTTVTLSKNATESGTAVIGYGKIKQINSGSRLISVEDFGGDPTGIADSKAAFVASLAATGVAYIPPGHTYKIATGLTLVNGQSIRGEGKTSKIVYLGTGPAILFDEECILDSFYLEGNTAGRVAGSTGLMANTTSPSDFDRILKACNVRVSYFDDGISCNFNGCFVLDNCYVTNCENGLYITGNQVNEMTVIGGEYRECVNGVLDDSSGGTYINNYIGVCIEGNSQYGFKKTTGGTTGQFLGCYFEVNDTQAAHDGADIFVDSPGVLLCFQIKHCHFGGTHTAIDIEAALGGVIDYNFFTTNTNTIKLGASARGVKVGSGNVFTAGTQFTAAMNLGSMNDVCTSPFPWEVRGNAAIDDGPGLQAWLAANPKLAKLPAGTYMISTPLTLLAGQTLEGEGWENTLIKPTTGFLGPLLTLNDDATVRNLQFIGIDEAGSTAVNPGTGKTRWLIDRCRIRDFADGITIDSNSLHGNIRNCRITSCTATGILCTTSSVHGLTIAECYIIQCPRNIHITTASQKVRIRDCYIASATTNGIEVTGGTLGLTIEGNYLENNTGADILLGSVTQSATMIVGNRFVTTPTSVSIVTSDNTLIEGNLFQPGGGTPKSIDITNAGAIRTCIGENAWLSGAFDYGTHNSGFATRYRGQIFRSGDPTGTGPWDKGEVVYNSAPASGVVSYWICTVGHATSATFIPGPDNP